MPTMRKNDVPTSSRGKQSTEESSCSLVAFFLDCLSVEDEISSVLRNVGTHIPPPQLRVSQDKSGYWRREVGRREVNSEELTADRDLNQVPTENGAAKNFLTKPRRCTAVPAIRMTVFWILTPFRFLGGSDVSDKRAASSSELQQLRESRP